MGASEEHISFFAIYALQVLRGHAIFSLVIRPYMRSVSRALDPDQLLARLHSTVACHLDDLNGLGAWSVRARIALRAVAPFTKRLHVLHIFPSEGNTIPAMTLRSGKIRAPPAPSTASAQAPQPYSAGRTVWEIAEIKSIILRWTDSPTLARCLRLSKKGMSEVARVLFREITYDEATLHMSRDTVSSRPCSSSPDSPPPTLYHDNFSPRADT